MRRTPPVLEKHAMRARMPTESAEVSAVPTGTRAAQEVKGGYDAGNAAYVIRNTFPKG